MLTVQLLEQSVVSGFGEVTLFIQESQETQFLWQHRIYYPQQPSTRLLVQTLTLTQLYS